MAQILMSDRHFDIQKARPDNNIAEAQTILSIISVKGSTRVLYFLVKGKQASLALAIAHEFTPMNINKMPTKEVWTLAEVHPREQYSSITKQEIVKFKMAQLGRHFF